MATAELALNVRIEVVELTDRLNGEVFLFHFWIMDWVNYLEELFTYAC
jgi:hypothetical protein